MSSQLFFFLQAYRPQRRPPRKEKCQKGTPAGRVSGGFLFACVLLFFDREIVNFILHLFLIISKLDLDFVIHDEEIYNYYGWRNCTWCPERQLYISKNSSSGHGGRTERYILGGSLANKYA